MKPDQQNKPQKASGRQEQVNWQQMNRKQRREITRKMRAQIDAIDVRTGLQRRRGRIIGHSSTIRFCADGPSLGHNQT
jgi:hypothetical protein